MAAALVAVAVALAAAHDAGARKFQMSGTWELRRGRGVFIPFQIATRMGLNRYGGMYVRTQTGTMGYGFPHGPAPGAGGVSATGSAPAALHVPPHRFGGSFSAQIPLNGVTQVQLTTRFGLDGPAAAAATLARGGGPGSFTWCPGDPACTAASVPLRQAGSRGQRVIYRGGGNRFGGVMRMLLQGRGVNSFVFSNAAFRVAHSVFRDPGSQQTGASYASRVMHYQPRGFATQPTIPPAMGSLVLHPGPKVTTMFGVSNTGIGPVLYFPAVATTPMGFQAGRSTTSTGFPWTTGTVLVQQAGYSSTLWALMGSDMRTALGAGNLSLVSGGLVQRYHLFGAVPRLNFGRVRMTFAPPVPSLSPSGVAAAAALVLLAAGYTLARRRRAPSR